jgi:hypothetical protein
MQFTAIDCAVTVTDTQITCRLPPGFGAGNVWIIVRNGQASPAETCIEDSPHSLPCAKMEYTPPSVLAVSVSGGAAAAALSNASGDVVVLSGLGFGPIPSGAAVAASHVPAQSPQLVVTYGPSGGDEHAYTAVNCVVVIAHTTAQCTTAPGVGGTLAWSAQLNVQVYVPDAGFSYVNGTAGLAHSSGFSYAGPSVDSVTVDMVHHLVVLHGTGFAVSSRRALAEAAGARALTGAAVQLFFGPPADPRRYSITSGCNAVSQSEIDCPLGKVPAGAGQGFVFTVIIGGVASPPSAPQSAQVFVATLPVVTQMPHALGPTNGSTAVSFAGNFSVKTPPIGVTATYGPYTATGCGIASATSITCGTVPGAGAGYTWTLNFDGYTVTDNTTTCGYAPSTVTKLTGGSALALGGGSVVALAGTNFGPLGTSITATYGPAGQPTLYSAMTCFVAVAHSIVQCTTVPGSGEIDTWTVTVGCGGSVVVGTASSVPVQQYATPIIYAITGAAAMNTAGGDAIAIFGLNFGATAPDATFSAAYGSYSATSCTVVSDSEMDCLSVPGSGGGLAFIVTINGLTSAPTPAIYSYGGPSIMSVASSLTPASTLSVQVGTVTITGTNFGATGTGVTMVYGTLDAPLTLSATACTVTTANNVLTCNYTASTGSELHWTGTLNGVTGPTSGVATSYATPIISVLQAASGVSLTALSTDGSQSITITGSGFANSTLSVAYGPLGATGTFLPECTFVSGTSITCTTAAGTGINHLWVVSVAGQVSPAYSGTSYAFPQIASVSGGTALATVGGDSITIAGSGFAHTATVTYGPVGATSTYTCTVYGAVTATQLTCYSTAGVGAGHVWVVTTRSILVSAASLSTTSYAKPSIGSVTSTVTTPGGDSVAISGSSFGPRDTAVKATYSSATFERRRPTTL